MAEKKESCDEKLIEELYEKLWWYTHEASDEEFDEKEVDAITRLLDILEPVCDDRAYASGADAALERFWERYGEEEENASIPDEAAAPAAAQAEESTAPAAAQTEEPVSPSAIRAGEAAAAEAAHAKRLSGSEIQGGEDRRNGEERKAERPADGTSQKPGRGSKWKKRFTRIAIGAAACLVLLISVNAGSYAIMDQSFFEIVREEMGRTEITVTGNVKEFETETDASVTCSSWKEVQEIVGEDILTPAYIPEGYELESLVLQDSESRKIVIGRYEKGEKYFLRFRIVIYDAEYRKDIMQYDKEWSESNGELNKEEQLKNNGNEFEYFFYKNNSVYYILGNENKDIIFEVVDGMK